MFDSMNNIVYFVAISLGQTDHYVQDYEKKMCEIFKKIKARMVKKLKTHPT